MNVDYRVSENGRKLTNDEIKMVAHWYLDGKSLREIAKYFNEKYKDTAFQISHVTIMSYFKDVLPHLDTVLAQEVAAALKDHLPLSIKNPDVVNRIKKSYEMFVNYNLSITEISNHFGVSFFTTYRDLERRLFLLYVDDKDKQDKEDKVTIEMVNTVKELMKTHRLDNLTPGSNAYLTENRDHGKFSR